jgi:PAS domain S-box-containing protein
MTERNAHRKTRPNDSPTPRQQGEFEALRILDQHPWHNLVLHPNKRIVWVNQAVCRTMGVRRRDLVGRYCHELWQNRRDPCPQCPVAEALRSGAPHRVETCIDGRTWNIHASPIFNDRHEISHVLVIPEDITERKRTRRALEESKSELFGILHAVTDHMSKIDDRHNILWANPVAERFFGPGLVGKKCYEVYHRSDRPCEPCIVSQCFEDGNIHTHETEVITSDGSRKTFRCVANAGIRDEAGHPRTVVEISRDITGWKNRQAMLANYHHKLRTLTGQLSLAEEKERRRIATEVHDQIGQKLAFVKIKLSQLHSALSASEHAEPLHEIADLIGSIIEDTRSLVSELGLPILYELGFVPAVKWLAETYRRKHDLPVKVLDDGHPKPLGDDIKTVLFQAVRELLANVIKHARATQCEISLAITGNEELTIEVEDNGNGFDVTRLGSPAEETDGFGLFSIRERLEPLGARFGIDSRPGAGTKATLVVPLSGERLAQSYERA